ncbi:MAG: universal stress protein [Chloroflexi bacterium]|nr:universal stress protein [Chloroflexota bacterium]
MFERILVPLDGSAAAESALPYAEEIAARSGADLILFSVCDPDALGMENLYRSYLEHVAERVQRELPAWGAQKEQSVLREVALGHPAVEILEYAEENKVSLIVMATRGGSAGGTWSLGNIASKVLQDADKPVLLVREPPDEAKIQERRLFKRILVPLDASERGGAVVLVTEVLARITGADLTLFHVLEPPPALVAAVPGAEFSYIPFSADEEARRASSAIEYLDRIEKTLKKAGVEVSSEVSSGSAAAEILRYAEAHEVDLIAMSTHGRSAIGRWVFGSVTEKVLHAAKTSVLIARSFPD